MSRNYVTPGVYVEEISTLPPSVAEVSTAIPAFFGYTTKLPGKAPHVEVVSTLLEFTELFGGAPPLRFDAKLNTDNTKLDTIEVPERTSYLYDSLRHYFKNGGGRCYIVAVGTYGDVQNPEHFSDGLARLTQEDEPTLIVLTDALLLLEADYYALCEEALRQCHDLGDRFAILDVRPTPKDAVEKLRDAIVSEYRAYGAAYHPYLETTLTHEYEETQVQIKPWRQWERKLSGRTIEVSHINTDDQSSPKIKFEIGEDLSCTEDPSRKTLTLKCKEFMTTSALITLVDECNAKKGRRNFSANVAGFGTGKLVVVPASVEISRYEGVVEIGGGQILVKAKRGSPPSIKVERDGAFGTPEFELSGEGLLIKIGTDADAEHIVRAWENSDHSKSQLYEISITQDKAPSYPPEGVRLKPVFNIGRTLEVRYAGDQVPPKVELKQGSSAETKFTATDTATDARLVIELGRDGLVENMCSVWGLVPEAQRHGFAVSRREDARDVELLFLDGSEVELVPVLSSLDIGPGCLRVTYKMPNKGARVAITEGGTPSFVVRDAGGVSELVIIAPKSATRTDIEEAWKTVSTQVSREFTVDQVKEKPLPFGTYEIAPGGTLASIKFTNTELYNAITREMGLKRITLPPSGAIAGVYASVDRDRGVWKAPANVGIASVIRPVEKINDEQQGRLNVDPTGGKSVNAIRAFTGRGTLVWGARTLDGNSNEWRYVPVRRLFNMIEESVKKASAFAVFEPNDMTTWLRVKGMIQSFLYGLWERGAVAGAKPEQAYFVEVGLGKTMTTRDILEGRMNVKIGVAAVRPAEFIILKFSHKLQEA